MTLGQLAFGLVALHFAIDFPLQGDTVAKQKSPVAGNGRDEKLNAAVPWYYWLTAHAVMQGGGVLLLTGSVTFALIETAAHWLIDERKCRGTFNMHVDQALHLACKAVYLFLVWQHG
jgi:hypothetical protein